MSKVQQLGVRTGKFFHLLIQTAGFLATVLTILAALGIGSTAFGFFTHTLPLTITGIMVLVLAGFIFIFVYSLLEEKVRVVPTVDDSTAFPKPKVDEDVEILLKEIVYQYFPDGYSMCQCKRLQLRALKDGVRHFTDKYRWTGYGKCTIKSLTPSYILTNERREEFWSKFDVNFPHPLRKGDDVDFTVEWHLVDTEKIAVPFLAVISDDATKQISLQVILPAELAPKRAYCYEFASYMDNLPITVKEIHWSPATHRLCYDVAEPEPHHKYSIHWYSE
jgi:hypothetical protein